MADNPRVLIVEARFYEDISDELAKGAIAVLDDAGVAHQRLAVPGAFEIPAAIAFAGGAFDGFIALGCVIRGETDHYDHICRECSRALMDMAVKDGVALGFGVLTCENYDQARVRAAVDRKNKGKDAAEACLRMMELKKTSAVT